MSAEDYQSHLASEKEHNAEEMDPKSEPHEMSEEKAPTNYAPDTKVNNENESEDENQDDATVFGPNTRPRFNMSMFRCARREPSAERKEREDRLDRMNRGTTHDLRGVWDELERLRTEVPFLKEVNAGFEKDIERRRKKAEGLREEMKSLKKENHELREEVERLKGANEGLREMVSYLDGVAGMLDRT